MPSKNSINNPKQTETQARKRTALAKKRADRARKGLTAPPRSADGSRSGLPKSTAVALYTGAQPTGRLTTTTLSKKRLHKIERNKKYVAKRREVENKLLIDATAKAEEEMDVDSEEKPAKKNSQDTKINSVKAALWSVVEDSTSDSLVVDSTGEGTTLGGPSFF